MFNICWTLLYDFKFAFFIWIEDITWVADLTGISIITYFAVTCATIARSRHNGISSSVPWKVIGFFAGVTEILIVATGALTRAVSTRTIGCCVEIYAWSYGKTSHGIVDSKIPDVTATVENSISCDCKDIS